MKILITDDAETVSVEVYPLPDPTAPADERGDPLFAARCRACPWDSFVDESTIHLTEADAINDAEAHLDHDHTDADAESA